MARIEVPVLRGDLVVLEPLEKRHLGDLVAAAAEDRGSFGFTSVPDGADAAADYIATQVHAADAGELVPFAQIRVSDGRAVGCTAYLNVRTHPGRVDPFAVEIGWTWLGASAQRTGINTEAKLLLLGHAFEAWRVVRVDLKTDSRNERSRRAIERLGARFEGVLRNWQPSLAAGEAGRYRDSAMFSIVAGEWPEVRTKLTASLASSEPRAGAGS
jgi:N-acetyltransferase